MKLLRVNMTTRKASFLPVPEKYKTLGGRGLTSIMINDEVPAKCDPLGPENKLIFAPGYFSGTPLINTSRLSIGAKSPLTGGIKESNVGGTAAYTLGRLGISAIIVEGRAPAGSSYLLKINADETVELISSPATHGLRTYALVEKLNAEYGDKVGITCIGPAGEFQMASASIQTTDLDGRPCRAAGRGGLGAVMGLKGLKAIIVDRSRREPEALADPEAFKTAAKAYAKAVKEDEFSGEILPELGTAVLVEPINAAGALPTCNATKGQFEGADKITGEAMAEVIKKRGGKTQHKGCAQCIIDCSNEFVDRQGRYVTYATTPMGADHTAGWVVDQNLEAFGGTIDALGAEGQVEASRDTQIHMAAVDSVGICDFAQSGLATPEGIENVYHMIAAKSGKPFSEADWTEMGLKVLKAEREFNRNAGFTNKDDRLPEMFYKEPLSPHNVVVKVTPEMMDTTFDF